MKTTKESAAISSPKGSTCNPDVPKATNNFNDNLLSGLLGQMDLEKYPVKGLVNNLRQMELFLIARDTHNAKYLSKLLNPEYHKAFATSSRKLRRIQSQLVALLSEVIGWNEEREVLPERSIIELLMAKERPFAVCISPLTVLGVQGKSLDYFVVTDLSAAHEINQEYDRDLYRDDLCTFDLNSKDLKIFEKAKPLFEKQSIGSDGEVYEYKDFKRFINSHRPVKRKKKSKETPSGSAPKKPHKISTTKEVSSKLKGDTASNASKDGIVSKSSGPKKGGIIQKNAKKAALKLDKKVTKTKANSTTPKSKVKTGRSNLKIVEPKRGADIGNNTAENKEPLLVDQPPTYVRSDKSIVVKRQSTQNKSIK